MRFLDFHVDYKVGSANIKPREAEKLFFISTYEQEDRLSPAPENHGYQRPPTKSRIPRIANYYQKDNNRNKIPSLEVSVRVNGKKDIDKFINLFNAGEIDKIKNLWGESCVSIIDGQHRYLGLVAAASSDNKFDAVIPLDLFFGWNFIEEAETFNAINTTPVRLPKALIEVTKGDITEKNSSEYPQTVRKIAFDLVRNNKPEPSVWHDEINMTGGRDPKRKITYEGLRRSTQSMFPRTLLERLGGFEPAKEVARLYWNLIADTCQIAWSNYQPPHIISLDDVTTPPPPKINYRIKELVGVASLARLGRDIISSALEAGQDNKINKGRLTDLVHRLGDVDWAKDKNNHWMSDSQAGFAGQKGLYEKLHALVYGYGS